jgi:hypothetical protein
MSFWAYLMYKEEQRTIQKVLDNRTKVLEMLDSSFTLMGNDAVRSELLGKVDNDLKEVLNYCKAQL